MITMLVDLLLQKYTGRGSKPECIGPIAKITAIVKNAVFRIENHVSFHEKI